MKVCINNNNNNNVAQSTRDMREMFISLAHLSLQYITKKKLCCHFLDLTYTLNIH